MSNAEKIQKEISTYKGLENFLIKYWLQDCEYCPIKNFCEKLAKIEASKQNNYGMECEEVLKIWLAQEE